MTLYERFTNRCECALRHPVPTHCVRALWYIRRLKFTGNVLPGFRAYPTVYSGYPGGVLCVQYHSTDCSTGRQNLCRDNYVSDWVIIIMSSSAFWKAVGLGKKENQLESRYLNFFITIHSPKLEGAYSHHYLYHTKTH